jgi:endonuclease
VAECSVTYTGRLRAQLPLARRLILVKDDGTVIVHADKGHKALNWMPSPCTIKETPQAWIVSGSKGETLEINLVQVHSDTAFELGFEPGLEKSGSETELQAILASAPHAIEPGARLISREYPTDLGPVDLLLEDPAGGSIVVEVKRVADIDAVDQVLRYMERLAADSRLLPMRGVVVGQRVKPQTRVYADSKGVATLALDFDLLSGVREADPTLF